MSRRKVSGAQRVRQAARPGKMPNAPTNRLELIQDMYERVMSELCMNRFVWHGLPASIDIRYLETVLFGNGLAVFWWDDRLDQYMVSAVAPVGRINMYNNPTVFNTVQVGGMPPRTLHAGRHPALHPDGRPILDETGTPKMLPPECVPIYTNYLRAPDDDIIQVYAPMLAELTRTIEINSNNMRHPAIIGVDESEVLTVQNMIKQVDEGSPYVIGTKNLADFGAKLSMLNLGVRGDELAALMIAKSKVWNEAMTMLGINNSNQDKRERLVADEVAANDDQISAFQDVALNERRKAADAINRLWGAESDFGHAYPTRAINLSVELRQPVVGQPAGAGMFGGFSGMAENGGRQ